MEDRSADERVTVSIRMPAEVHRAASVAAAQSGKSLNAWLTDLAAAASGAANAATLLVQVRNLNLSDDGVRKELVSRFTSLIQTALDHTAGQLSEIADAVYKAMNTFQSLESADAIKRARKK